MIKTTTTEAFVLRKDTNGISELTLNRPRQYNALSMAMLEAIMTELVAIEKDESIKVVIISAVGKAFCPGHDLKEIRNQRNRAFVEGLFAKCTQMMLKIRSLKQIVIAKVQGVATAAGCQLVATCDLAIAAEQARFATSGVNYGIYCSTPAVPLSRNIHPKKALEMLITGGFISAKEAKEEGLVNKVVAAEELDEAVLKMATIISQKGQDALTIGKQMFYEQLNMDVEAAYAYASDKIACSILSPDGEEGLNAFAEKRKPNWNK
ncbi:MAG: enoyl-CoA hydratase [Saprospiraceae bacterium]